MTLFFGLLFGAIGSGFLIYGKREHSSIDLVTGFLLVVYPYFFSNPVVIVVVGALLIAIPIAHRKGVF